MKKLIHLVFFLLISTQWAVAQPKFDGKIALITSEDVNTNELDTRFTSNNLIKIKKSDFVSKEATFFTFSLGLMDGLKYRSIIDQFSSTPMFDSRAYQPISVTDYNNYLERNYFIINSHPNIWQAQ